MSGRTMILCAGEQDRWSAPAPKQLVKVTDNEVLLARTIRQCRLRFSGEDPLIISHQSCLRAFSKNAIYPKRRRYIVETLLSSSPCWGDNWSIVLLGDVYYSDAAINDIIDKREKYNYRFYGGEQEIYALTYTDKALILDHLSHVLENVNGDTVRGKLWDLYYSLSGVAMEKSGHGRVGIPDDYDSEHFGVINDSTSDFDKPESYSDWYKQYVRRA